jgi:hypothetical protein
MKNPKNTNLELWKHLSTKQQKEWIALFKIFNNELNLLSKISNDVKAHNLAYEAVWRMNG